MSAMILDTELTSLVDPDVIELAYTPVKTLVPDQDLKELHCERFHPREGKKISPAAMAVHHIIPEDLATEVTWPGSWDPQVEYLIGHNIDCDWAAIGRPNCKRICTMAMSRYLWDGADGYSLGALIYLHLPPDQARHFAIQAHGAKGDVGMTWLLLGVILDEAAMRCLIDEHPTFEQLWEFSEMARIPRRIGFGKHGPKDGQPGKFFDDIPTDYLQWMVEQSGMDEYALKAARKSLEKR